MQCDICHKNLENLEEMYHYILVYLRNPKGKDYNKWSKEPVWLCLDCQGTLHGRYKRVPYDFRKREYILTE